MPLNDKGQWILPQLTRDLPEDLSSVFTPPIPEPTNLSTELGRSVLAFEAGQQSVIAWIENRLKESQET